MLGIQAYTVREHLADQKSALAAMKALKAMGYECVQLWAWKGLTEIMANAAREAGLSVIGILGSIDVFDHGDCDIFEVARLCGARELGISSAMKTEKEALETVCWANRFAKSAAERGFTFAYHNHSNEFIRTEGGKTLMDILLEGFDKEHILFMPDTYWLQHGGVDVRDFLEKLTGRVNTLHLKDMKRTAEGVTFAEVGLGNMNMKGILETARKIGVRDFIVEQDKCDGDSMESAKHSCEYLRTIL